MNNKIGGVVGEDSTDKAGEQEDTVSMDNMGVGVKMEVVASLVVVSAMSIDVIVLLEIVMVAPV
jgi:hypothetical protein